MLVLPVTSIVLYMGYAWHVELTYIFCEANQVVDHLAKTGSLGYLPWVILDHPPPEVHLMLHLDVMSTAFPRL